MKKIDRSIKLGRKEQGGGTELENSTFILKIIEDWIRAVTDKIYHLHESALRITIHVLTPNFNEPNGGFK
jgi:hypothetical protein